MKERKVSKFRPGHGVQRMISNKDIQCVIVNEMSMVRTIRLPSLLKCILIRKNDS